VERLGEPAQAVVVGARFRGHNRWRGSRPRSVVKLNTCPRATDHGYVSL
jgi:hypothetical protein